jgi:hypothetical protein
MAVRLIDSITPQVVGWFVRPQYPNSGWIRRPGSSTVFRSYNSILEIRYFSAGTE